MFYAGNGTLLVSFQEKKYRDAFIKDHVSFCAEPANMARQYPQFEFIKNHAGAVRDTDCNVNDYWTDAVYESLSNTDYFDNHIVVF